MTFRMLLEVEVAELLRCSTTKVKRLRLSGKLAYVPGRPVLIAETDLDDYIQREREASVQAPSATETPQDDAVAWALRVVNRGRRK